MHSPQPDGSDTKAQFRKLSNDAANRKYRRHSPSNASPSSDESPKRDDGSSANLSGGDSVEVSEQRTSMDHRRELDKETQRNHYGKGGESYRNSDIRSSRDSSGYSKHEAYSRGDKYADREERRYQESFHSGRSSRSERLREKNDRGRSKQYVRDSDKCSRERYETSGYRSDVSFRKHMDSIFEEKDKDCHRLDKGGWDERKDYHRSSRYQKSDRALNHEESGGYRNEYRGKDNSDHCMREINDDDAKEVNTRQERKKHTGWDANRSKDQDDRASREQDEDKFVLVSENQRSPAKKPKLLNSDKDADEKQSSSLKKTEDTDGKVILGHASVDNSTAANELNTATVAAMKAAELVNRNLVGTSFMSTEQKKKLLWGNKKSTTAEQSGTQWNTSLFGDRERQEKFNKLMGVKGDMKEEHKPETPDGGQLLAEKQKELQMDLEKQYTAGLRRRDGRTVGLGL